MKITSGQVAVVTGAASGIGLAIARALSARGVAVVLADVDVEALTSAEKQITGPTLVHRTDVTDPLQLEALAAATLETFGRVDILCNNAGVAPPPARFIEHPLAAWRWTMDVALMGAVNGVRAFLPHLVEQGSGHVLNTASVAGLVPIPLVAPYCAAKYALVGMTECLADELSRTAPGVGVTLLCPGLVETRLSETSSRHAPEGLVGIESSIVDPGEFAILIERSGEMLSAESVAEMALEGGLNNVDGTSSLIAICIRELHSL